MVTKNFMVENSLIYLKTGWEVQFDGSNCYDIPVMTNYKDHVAKYFQFYADFEYELNIMSTCEGRALRKFNYKYRNQNSTLSIYGPIEQDHNIGKKVIHFKVIQYKSLCHGISRSLNL